MDPAYAGPAAEEAADIAEATRRSLAAPRPASHSSSSGIAGDNTPQWTTVPSEQATVEERDAGRQHDARDLAEAIRQSLASTTIDLSVEEPVTKSLGK